MLKINPFQINKINNTNVISFSSDISSDAINYKKEGNEYLTYNKPDKAIECYKKAISISPEYADAYFNLGKAYIHKKQYSLAEAQLEQATKLTPNDIESHIVLGETYKNNGKYQKAIKSFETALSIDPESDYAKRNLAETKNFQYAIFNTEMATNERKKQAENNLNEAITIAKNYLPNNYFQDLNDLKISFDTTATMGGHSNLAQYEHAKRKITITKDFIWANPTLVSAYLIHEFVHAKDNDAYTSITEEQDAYEQAAKFWVKNAKKKIKDPEMDYVAELYKTSPQKLKDRVAEIYKIRDPHISQTSPNHPPQNSNAATTLSKNTNSQPLKSYNVIA